MATQHNRGGATALPLALIGQAVPMLSRHELASLTQRLIEALDYLEGDADLEPNGDEVDGSLGAEDEFCPPNVPLHLQGPGCPIADPDLAADDVACDEPEQDLEEEHSIGDFSDPLARREQRDRIRRTRCGPRMARRLDWRTGRPVLDLDGFDLRDEPTVPTKRQLFRRKRGVPPRPRG